MCVPERTEPRKPIIVDPKTIELDAIWRPSWWLQIVQAFSRIRHQPAIAGIAGIVGMVWLAGVQAHHTPILALAIGCCAGIAVATEWIHRRPK
jgi:hypothetical protein